MNSLTQFHFLRPEWLILLVPAGFIIWSVLKRHDDRSVWNGVIESHLLDHLLIKPKQNSKGLKPVWVLAMLFLTGVLALSGPAWQKEPTPFTEDQAAVVIILKVTPEMLAKDIQPSRLQRASHKIADLLELRPGTKNALIAYAGSAHLVMPMTTDTEIINSFATELSPAIMPLEGDAPSEAIKLANKRIRKSGLSASIVLIADSIPRAEIDLFKGIAQESTADIHFLAIAAGSDVIPPPGSPPAPALNLGDFQSAADAIDGSLTIITIDDSDVQGLASSIEKSFANAPLQEGTRWRDAGFYLLPVCIILMLLLFREGGSVPLASYSRGNG